LHFIGKLAKGKCHVSLIDKVNAFKLKVWEIKSVYNRIDYVKKSNTIQYIYCFALMPV